MKQLNTATLTVTFAGCFLGAGYVSGQETWQFFGRFGSKGLWSLGLAMILMAVVGLMLLSLCQRTGLIDMAHILVRRELPRLRIVTGGFQSVFLLCVAVIMTAGAGALLHQLLNWPTAVGSGLFCILLFFGTLTGLKGMLSAFWVLVPLLTAATLVTAFSTPGLLNGTWQQAAQANSSTVSWFSAVFSGLCFLSYNLGSSIGVLTPLSEHLAREKTARLGIPLGALLLFLIAGCIQLSLLASPLATTQELPMLALAQTQNQVLGWFYGFLLLWAMFCAALSCLFALLSWLNIQLPSSRQTALRSGVCCAACFGFGLIGFRTLIGTIYPVFGVLYFAAICSIIWGYFFWKGKRLVRE